MLEYVPHLLHFTLTVPYPLIFLMSASTCLHLGHLVRFTIDAFWSSSIFVSIKTITTAKLICFFGNSKKICEKISHKYVKIDDFS